MYQPKREKDIWCPFEYGFDVFGGKWRPRIICVLADKGVMRYSVLRSEMTNITDAILSTALKSLINDGIVERRQYEEVPLRVEYSLSEKGWSLVPVIQNICKWSGTYNQTDSENTFAQCLSCEYSGKK